MTRMRHESAMSDCKTSFAWSVVAETLNTKMNWLKNYERIISIEQQLVWQPVTELDPRTYVPEVNFIIVIIVVY